MPLCATISKPGVLEQARDAFTQEDGVVGEDYAHAAKTSSCGTERRELRLQPIGIELEQALRLVDARQLVLAEIVDVVGWVELLSRARREQDLPAAARLADACRPVHIEPEVRALTDGRLAGVHPHAHAKGCVGRPLVLREGLLRRDEGVGGGFRVREGDEELVAPLVDDDPVPLVHRRAEETAVVVEDVRVVVAETLDELRRPFDIREDECDCSMRKIRHASLLQRDLGADTGSRRLVGFARRACRSATRRGRRVRAGRSLAAGPLRRHRRPRPRPPRPRSCARPSPQLLKPGRTSRRLQAPPTRRSRRPPPPGPAVRRTAR